MNINMNIYFYYYINNVDVSIYFRYLKCLEGDINLIN